MREGRSLAYRVPEAVAAYRAQVPEPGEAVQRVEQTSLTTRRLVELSRNPPREGHVYTARAELEGTLFEPVLRALVEGWQGLGQSPVSLQEYATGLDLAHLPRCVIMEQAVPGAPGLVSAQGKEFLASSR